MRRLYRWLPVALLLPLPLFVPRSASADCCTGCTVGCPDGSPCDGSWYCGVGPCNIMGCDCAGGCRISQNRDQCTRYCDEQSRQNDMMCTDGCPPQVLDSCSIECSRQAADWKRSCMAGCDQQFPAGAAAVSAPAGSLAGLTRFAMVDGDRSGYIDQKEFQAFAATRHCNAKTPPTPEEAAQVFAKLDKDGNKQLTLDEMDPDATPHLQKRASNVNLGKEIDTAYAQRVLTATTTQRKEKK